MCRFWKSNVIPDIPPYEIQTVSLIFSYANIGECWCLPESSRQTSDHSNVVHNNKPTPLFRGGNFTAGLVNHGPRAKFPV
jgi:hypothetical protein